MERECLGSHEYFPSFFGDEYQYFPYLSIIFHPHEIKTHTVFVDDYFVYFVISRPALSDFMSTD